MIAFMADVGQEEDFDAAEKKAMAIGAKKFFCVVSEILVPPHHQPALTRSIWFAGPPP